MKNQWIGILLLPICLLLNGCTVLRVTGTAVKMTGTAVSTGIKTAGAVIAAPFKAIGNDNEQNEAANPTNADQ